MEAVRDLSDLSVEALAEGIRLRAGRIAAAQAELLAWVAEFDRRDGWAGVGMLSCAHWLTWNVGLSAGAAREHVRVARRLEELPSLAAAFRDGRVSYSQARAISRVAEPGDGIDWVDLARHASAAQLERLVRGIARARSHDEVQGDPEEAAWKVRTRRRYDDDGNLVITITTRPEYAPVVEAGLAAKRAELERELAAVCVPAETSHADAGTPRLPEHADAGQGVPAETPPPVVTDGDALLTLAQEALVAEQQSHPDAARHRRPQLVAHVDPLSGWARLSDGELLPPTNLRAVMKAFPGRSGVVRLRPLTDADLRRHDLGRTAREANDALRTLLGALDGERCRFPGCTRHKKLHAHHVLFWRDGGPTDLDNLVLVCSRHHTLIHSQDFRLTLHPDRRLEVRTADDVAVLHHPAQPWGDPATIAAGPGRHVSAGTLPPDHCDTRLDLEYAVSVLLAQAA